MLVKSYQNSVWGIVKMIHVCEGTNFYADIILLAFIKVFDIAMFLLSFDTDYIARKY